MGHLHDPRDAALRYQRVDVVSASRNAALDHAVSFVVDTLFDEKSSKRELLLLKTLFLPVVRITVVPRGRPILASIVDIEELFRIKAGLFSGSGKWIEAFRVHEDGATDESVRVHVNVSTQGGIGAMPRTADVMFAAKAVDAGRWVIRSCNVVYDEKASARSPVTLVS